MSERDAPDEPQEADDEQAQDAGDDLAPDEADASRSGPLAITLPATAGTVAIVGRPNVGKSTLLNQIVGEKLAIVSPLPQTTRNRIVGVWTGEVPGHGLEDARRGQIVFVDTPGVHLGRGALNKFMVDEAYAALEQVDAVLLVVEAEPGSASGLPGDARRGHPAEARLIEESQRTRRKMVLAVNKVDKVKDKPRLLPTLETWSKRADFAAIVPVSATRGVGVTDVVRALLAVMPEGPPLYPADMLTDRTERFLAGELIREQLFLRLKQELPYATAVLVDNWQERPETNDVVIDATILVERDTQKAIVVGKGGQMIKDIGTAARTEITTLIGRPAHLRLHVKVATEWTATPEGIARLGYRKGE